MAGLIKADGSGIEFMRTINALGLKEKVTGNSSLERIIPFTYGKLIQISMLNGLVLQSKTRSYLAGTGEWASVDTAALWNPDLLLQNPGNWNAVEYASGDGVNKIDEKGTWSELAQMFEYHNFRQEFDVYKDTGKKIIETYLKIATTGIATMAGAEPGLALVSPIAEKALVGLGSYSTANPEKTEKIISNGFSAVNELFFEGKGSAPGAPENFIDIGKGVYDFVEEVSNEK